MSTLALTNCFAYVAGYDFTSDSNTLQLQLDAAALDATTFGSSGWMENKAGLKSTAFNMGGFWQSAATDAVDPQAFGGLGVSRVVTFGPTQTEGEVAYFFRAMKSQYVLGGDIGTLMPFTVAAVGSDGVGAVRGALIKKRGTVSTTGATGTALELPAVAADESVYVALHVFSAGTTITVDVESDSTSDFESATKQGTFTVTAAGGYWMTPKAGAITDTHWRLNVSAITGSFIIAAAIGIR